MSRQCRDLLEFGHRQHPCMLERHGDEMEHLGPAQTVDGELCRLAWMREDGQPPEVHMRAYDPETNEPRDIPAREATRWERLAGMVRAIPEQYRYLRQHGPEGPARWRCAIAAFALARAAMFRKVRIG